MAGWTSSSWPTPPSDQDKQYNHAQLSIGSCSTYTFEEERDQRERAKCWRNLTEYSSPYKVGLIQMVQRLLKAVVYVADFHSNVCLHRNVRLVKPNRVRALSFNKRCTICISLSLTIKRGKRLVKPFIFILASKRLSKFDSVSDSSIRLSVFLRILLETLSRPWYRQYLDSRPLTIARRRKVQ